MKNLLFLSIILIIVTGGFLITKNFNNHPLSQSTNQIKVTNIPTKTVSVAPLKEENFIHLFFTAINGKRIEDAVNMLNPDLIKDNDQKQSWGTQFKAFTVVTLKTVEAVNKNEWTERKHIYKVVFSAQMQSESANAPIPYYCYENGENTRWITLEKVNGFWKISEIATGP